jgi:hypothetical protein
MTKSGSLGIIEVASVSDLLQPLDAAVAAFVKPERGLQYL